MGGSISLAILNNQYKFPSENDPYSDDLRRLIRSMLVTDPKERADIQTVRINLSPTTHLSLVSTCAFLTFFTF